MRTAAFLLALGSLAGCRSGPPFGEARVEIALPEQARVQPGAISKLHADELMTVNLLRVTAPVPMHRHRESAEVVYLLSGAGILQLDSVERPLAAGDLVVVPRNTPHGFVPTSEDEPLLLQLFVPPFTEGDRIFLDPETP